MFRTFFSELALALLANSALAQGIFDALPSVDVLPDGVVQLPTNANSAGVLTAGQEYRRRDRSILQQRDGTRRIRIADIAEPSWGLSGASAGYLTGYWKRE